jgi:hypothetical protein
MIGTKIYELISLFSLPFSPGIRYASKKDKGKQQNPEERTW